MKILHITGLLVFFSCCLALRSAAQPATQDDSLGTAGEPVIPPMSVLMDSALRYNPMVRFRDQGIDVKVYNLKSWRNYWTRNIGLQADTRYGTFDNFSTNTSEGQIPSTFATRSNQWNYGVGAYIKFPVYDAINHRNQVRQAKAELNQAECMADAQRDELRQAVIRQYNDVMLKQKLLRIKSKNLGDAKVNRDMIEKEFHNGVVPVSEYARITDIVARIESEYESARADFTTAYMILENIAGFKFTAPQPTHKK